jgi:hypothetical protein
MHRNNWKVVRARTHTHAFKPLCEYKDVTVLRHQEVHTETEIMANRPAATVNKTYCVRITWYWYPLANHCCSGKATNLTCVCVCERVCPGAWACVCACLRVVTGATAIVTKGSKKSLKAIPGKHSMDLLQKTAMGITADSREVPGREGLWEDTWWKQ